MSTPEKPNVEYDDPAKMPSLKDRGNGPAERAVLGPSGYGTIVRILVAVAIFILGAGSIFYFLNA